MALENIINRILEDTNTKAHSLLGEARSKAEDVLKKAKDESAALSKRILDEAKTHAKLDMERTYISKNLEIKKEILRKKRELIDNAFEEAFKRTLKLDDKTYTNIIEYLILQNISEGKETELRFYKNDKKEFWKELIDRLNKKRGLNIRLGTMLEKEDKGFIARRGNIILNFTFSEGFELSKDKIEFEVSKILFG